MGPGFDPNPKSIWAADKKSIQILFECTSRFKQGDFRPANRSLCRISTKRRTRAEYNMFGVDDGGGQEQVLDGIVRINCNACEGHV